MSYLFENARIINPVQRLNTIGSIRLSRDGIIEDIAFGDNYLERKDADRVFNFSKKIISSGLFDMHVHFREPGFEHKETFETGTKSAIRGGFTGVAVMPNTFPAIDTVEMVAYVKQKTRHFPIEIVPVGAITVGRNGRQLTNLGLMYKEGALAFSDDGSAVMNSRVMRMALEYSSQVGALVIQHCEDSCLSAGGVINEGLYSSILGLGGIPSISESIILERDISLLRYLKEKKGRDMVFPLRYHVAHISTKEGVNLLRSAKEEGLPVTAEVTPHHLSMTEEDVFNSGFDGNFKMNPPLRSAADKDILIKALSEGVIDCIATDHAPHAQEEKGCGLNQAEFGVIGLETSLGITISQLVDKKKITMYQAIELLSTRPRKILSLSDIEIKKGVQANLTFIDPYYEWRVQQTMFKSKAKNTLFSNHILKGRAVGVACQGVVMLDDQIMEKL